MLRKVVLFCLPLVLVLAACGDDNGDDSSDSDATAEATATVETSDSTATAEPAEATPTSMVIATPDLGGASSILGTANPFQFLDAMGSAGSFSTDVDPSLKGQLLVASDLPSGYMPMGEFSMAVPSEYGEMQMAANMFASGDMTTGEFGAMAMSASILVPPDALDEFTNEALDQITSLSDEELASALGGAEAFGVSFSELDVLDGSDLGDGGVGLHMAMDFGALSDAFGAPGDENPFEEGIAMDMFMFLKGDHMIMTMVMSPAVDAAGADARNLAEILDARSGGSNA
jgi:hypothetical protein